MPPAPRLLLGLLLPLVAGCAPRSPRPAAAAPAAAPAPASAAVMAVVDSALTHINAGDLAALSDLMLPEAQVFPSRDRDGEGVYTVRTVAQQRAAGRRPPIIERGFDAEVRVSGTVAVVWLPYDLYAEGAWSNCGADILTLVRVGSAWRIANFTYSVEQPPACREHPAGTPPGQRPRPKP